MFGNMFVSSLIIDSDGIKEKWLFVITRKRLRWSDVEDYYFEPYSPYPKSRLICTQNVMMIASRVSQGTDDPFGSSQNSSVLRESLWIPELPQWCQTIEALGKPVYC